MKRLFWLAAGWAGWAALAVVSGDLTAGHVPVWMVGVWIVGVVATVAYVLFDDSHLPPRQRPPRG